MRKEESPPHRAASLRALLLLVLFGLLLRLFLVLSAENRLGADEATTAVMAIDIAEGKAFPFFFYGTSYNGGGAIEAYGAALLFVLFGPSAVALKLWLLLTWLLSALLLAGLCRRALAPPSAILALLFFAVGSPFFLEWSLKARGGFAETVFFTVALLWIAFPPPRLERRPRAQAALLGLGAGIGWWASEMILPMIPFAAALLFIRRPRGERSGALLPLLAGLAIGLAPLLAYNLTSGWAHLRQSAVLSFFSSEGGGAAPLGMGDLLLSARFVLGPAWFLALAGLLVAAVRLGRSRGSRPLARLLLAHTILYLAGYWLHGYRYLPLPPSRVLYALYPGIAVLLGIGAASRGTSRPARILAAAAIAAWSLSVAIPVIGWAASGEPREAGSWRGSWSLVPARELFQQLKAQGVDAVYANYWTSWSLRFAVRSEAFRKGEAPEMIVSSTVPLRRAPHSHGDREARNAAFVLRSGSPLERRIREVLASHRIEHRRIEWRSFALYLEIDPARIHQGEGFPPTLAHADWDRPPERPDGFN